MKRRDRGAVLMLVLGAVMILVILAVELAARANVDIMFAGRTAREAALRLHRDSRLARRVAACERAVTRKWKTEV